jgi:hypothetical protein
MTRGRLFLIVMAASLLMGAHQVSAKAKYEPLPGPTVDKEELRAIAKELADIAPARNFGNVAALDRAASYIKARLIAYGYKPAEQVYVVEGREYRNVTASIGPETAPRFVVGAHYDVAGDQPGADDNASGIAGLLALARLFRQHDQNLSKRIDFVAFTLEEPPFFRTTMMGSYVHAKSLHDSSVDVLGMVALEMIGFFSDQPGSQSYPLPFMNLFYPTKGDFIGIVGNYKSSRLIAHFQKTMERTSVGVETLRAPSLAVNVHLSDHINYSKFGYQAIMITDTSFYRNPHYHKSSDSVETLDFEKMAEVVKGLYWSIIGLSARDLNNAPRP